MADMDMIFQDTRISRQRTIGLKFRSPYTHCEVKSNLGAHAPEFVPLAQQLQELGQGCWVFALKMQKQLLSNSRLDVILSSYSYIFIFYPVLLFTRLEVDLWQGVHDSSELGITTVRSSIPPFLYSCISSNGVCKFSEYSNTILYSTYQYELVDLV